MHAILVRQFANRVKGRDYFDLGFYIQRNTAINLAYLEAKLRESGHWTSKEALNIESLRQLYLAKVASVDFKKAQEDVLPFIKPELARSVKEWSYELFRTLAEKLRSC